MPDRKNPPLPDPTAADRARARRRLWWLRLMLPVWLQHVWLVVITGLVVWALVLWGEQSDSAARNARQTNTVLCVFRRDLEDRAAGARKFLRDHPHGFAGISASAIRVSLLGQERTIAALSGLRCD